MRGVPASARDKKNERHTDQKEGVKLSLFIEHMGIYVENVKESTKRLLKLISEVSKTARHKGNT